MGTNGYVTANPENIKLAKVWEPFYQSDCITYTLEVIDAGYTPRLLIVKAWVKTEEIIFQYGVAHGRDYFPKSTVKSKVVWKNTMAAMPKKYANWFHKIYKHIKDKHGNHK